MVPHIFLAQVDMGLLEEAIFAHNLCHNIHRMVVVGFSQVSALCNLSGCRAAVGVDHVDRNSRRQVDHIDLCLMGSVDDIGEDRVHLESRVKLDMRIRQSFELTSEAQ